MPAGDANQDRWLWFVDEELLTALSGGPEKPPQAAAPGIPGPAPAPEEPLKILDATETGESDYQWARAFFRPAFPVASSPAPAPPELPIIVPPAARPRGENESLWEKALEEVQAGQFELALKAYREILNLDPDQAAAQYNTGVCMQELGRFNLAKEAFELALNLDPALEGARVGLAWCLLRLQKADDALAAFDRNLALMPGDWASLMGRAQALHLLGREEEARHAYIEILDREPANPDVLANLIAISAAQPGANGLGEYSAALFRIHPRSRQALAGIVTTDLHNGDYHAAAVHGADFVDAEPNSYEGWFNLGLATQNQGRLKEAEQAYRKALELQPSHGSAKVNLGALLLDQPDREGTLAEAASLFQDQLQAEPGNAAALSNLALIAYRQGNLADAEPYLLRLVQAHPERTGAAFNLGAVRFHNKNWTGAIQTFQECLAQRHDWSEAWVYLGLSQWGAGVVESAQASFDQALLNDPIFVPALQCRTALALAMRDRETAPELEAQLADLGQTLPELCYNLGVLQYEAKRYDQAAQAYRRAIAKKPAFSEALLNLGHSLAALGSQPEAVEHWRNALALQPELAAGYFS